MAAKDDDTYQETDSNMQPEENDDEAIRGAPEVRPMRNLSDDEVADTY